MFERMKRNRRRREWQRLARSAHSVYADLRGGGAREIARLVATDRAVQREVARALRLIAGRGPGGRLRGRAAGLGVTLALSLLRGRQRRGSRS